MSRPRRSCRSKSKPTDSTFVYMEVDDEDIKLSDDDYQPENNEESNPEDTSTSKATPKTNNPKTVKKDEPSSSIKVATIEKDPLLKSSHRENYCLYCSQSHTHIARHLVRRHKTETLVKEVIRAKKGSEQKSIIFEKLRNLGNLKHNSKVIKNKTGTLKPRRRSNINRNVAEYLPCINCKGLYIKTAIKSHKKICKMNINENTNKMGLKASVYDPDNISEEFEIDILNKMRNDEVRKILIKDELIIKFGAKLYNECEKTKINYLTIRSILRNLSKLLIEIKKLNNNIEFFEEVLDENNWDLLIATLLNIAITYKCNYITPREYMYTFSEILNQICDFILNDELCSDEIKSQIEEFIVKKDQSLNSEVIDVVKDEINEDMQGVSGSVDVTVNVQNVSETADSIGENLQNVQNSGDVSKSVDIAINVQSVSKTSSEIDSPHSVSKSEEEEEIQGVFESVHIEEFSNTGSENPKAEIVQNVSTQEESGEDLQGVSECVDPLETDVQDVQDDSISMSNSPGMMQESESEDSLSDAPPMDTQDSSDSDLSEHLRTIEAALDEEQIPTQESEAEEEDEDPQQGKDQIIEFSNIKIPSLNPKSNLKLPQRQNYCLFCFKVQTHIARHILRQHKKEPSVKKILNIKPGSKIRLEILEKLRKEGNAIHNTKVLNNKSGTLRLNCRSNKLKSIDEILPCIYCKHIFTKSTLIKHRRICEKIPKNIKKCKLNSKYASTIASVTLFSVSNISEEFKSEILYKMNNNDIHRIIIKDKLIIKYGCKIYSENQGSPSVHANVKSCLRELGKIVLEAQKIDGNIYSIEQLLNINYWDILVTVIVKIYVPENKTAFNTSGKIITKIGDHIDQICNIILADSSYDDTKKDDITEFIKMKSEKWNSIIEKTTEKLNEKKFNNKDLLNLVEDIKKITEYLKNEINIIINKLKNNNGTQKLWFQLAKLIQCRIILFNRKNIKEISNLQLTDYEKKVEPVPTSNNSIDIHQFFCSIMTQVEKIDKNSQSLSLLLTKDMIEAIDMLNETRISIGNINPENEFIFANTKTYIRGHVSFKEITECINNIKSNNILIKGTQLKWLVTYIGQIIGLGQFEFGQFTVFLSCNLKLYSNYYKLQENEVIIAKLSLILLDLELENDNKYSGKKLEDIELESISTSFDNVEIDTDEVRDGEVIGQSVPNPSGHQDIAGAIDEVIPQNTGPSVVFESPEVQIQNLALGFEPQFVPSDIDMNF